jgi:hypothetical protein
MEPREYADVRRYALVRAAVELGVPAEDAPGLVERVLEEQSRRIRRAEDPDPLVHEALAEAVRRRGGRRRSTADRDDRADQPDRTAATDRAGGTGGAGGTGWRGRAGWPAIVALAIALVAVGVAATALRPARPPAHHLRDDQVPSLFGYDVGSARRLLTGLGLDVTVRPIRSCEILGRAVGADPPTGATFRRGDHITLFAAIPANVECLTDYSERSSAWRFVDFATGHAPAPPFARRVRVYVGPGSPFVLRRAEAVDPASWAQTGVLSALRDASADVELTRNQPVTYAVPTLEIVPFTDRRSCGGPLRPEVPSLPGLSFVIRAPAGGGCLVHVDLLRTSEDPAAPIAAVVLHTGAG